MTRIRVLVVDDSVVVRRLVGKMLDGDSEVEVVGTASGGRVAIEKLDLLSPDVVLLDVEMPEMDGLQTLAAIRRLRPRLPVIMFSQHTQRGATTTAAALAMGATDCVCKPDGLLGPQFGPSEVRATLLAKVKLFYRGPVEQTPPSNASRLLQRPMAVLIGVSTGGPNALSKVLGTLPEDLAVPVLIVQHMPPLFTKLLTERLALQCPFRVREAENGLEAMPGEVYLCPGDYHMELTGPRSRPSMRLHQGPLENSVRPAVDVLFRSVTGPCLAVVLTGMGHDGLRGAETVRAAGGVVLVQDEASSVVWGMPGAIVRAGLADGVFPIDELAGQIAARVGTRRAVSPAIRPAVAHTPGD